MSTTTIESSPVYRDCIVEGIVCITCNGTVPVSALGLKKHEMKCHTKWYQMQYQKASDLNRRQGIVADFKNAVINILNTFQLSCRSEFCYFMFAISDTVLGK